jgi:outer membrane protein, multidrug efflux system
VSTAAMGRAAGTTMLAVACMLAPGCMTVGQDYQKPREALPASFKESGPWKEAAPGDLIARGEWWQIFGDPVLDQLEAEARRNSPRLQLAMARVEQARAVAGIAESYIYPYVAVDATAARYRASANRPDQPSKLRGNTDYESNAFRVPLYASYEIDIWGRARRAMESARAQTDASIAAYQTVLLSLEGDVAQAYFALRITDEEVRILRSSVELRRRARDLVAARKQSGIAGELDLVRVETELAAAEAEVQAALRRRADLEHGLAVLIGKLPENFALPEQPLSLKTPAIPPELPSTLLERRPDVVEAERLLAARNAEIGVAQGAYFPSIRLTAGVGFESHELSSLFDGDSLIWNLAAGLSQPLFDGGRIRGNIERTKAAYQENFAVYRQRLLVAFQDVDNALSGLRILDEQATAQARAVANSQKALTLATARYKAGLVIVLEVIDAERTSLQAQRQNVQILNQQMAASVALIKALGGGWQGRPAPGTAQQQAGKQAPQS